jgi:hypothetical protein
MTSSGINIDKFNPHSTRSAATSRASVCSVPLDQILSTAGWSLANTLAKFYNKQIYVNNGFANKILTSVNQ